jgi:hypothetical protein
MQVLHHHKKSTQLNIVQRYYIHAEFITNNHLNGITTSFSMQFRRYTKDPPAINTTPPPPKSSHSQAPPHSTPPTISRLHRNSTVSRKVTPDVESIINAIKRTVTSSWGFFSTHMQRCTDKHTSSLP